MASRKRFKLLDVAGPYPGVLKHKLKRPHLGVNASYVQCEQTIFHLLCTLEDAWRYSKNVARAAWKLWLFVISDDPLKLCNDRVDINSDHNGNSSDENHARSTLANATKSSNNEVETYWFEYYTSTRLHHS